MSFETNLYGRSCAEVRGLLSRLRIARLETSSSG
jgi:hypothetical protein